MAEIIDIEQEIENITGQLSMVHSMYHNNLVVRSIIIENILCLDEIILVRKMRPCKSLLQRLVHTKNDIGDAVGIPVWK